MNEEYFKEHAARLRNIAGTADPFTKRRLLELAERYDRRKSPRTPTPLPMVTMADQQRHDGEVAAVTQSAKARLP